MGQRRCECIYQSHIYVGGMNGDQFLIVNSHLEVFRGSYFTTQQTSFLVIRSLLTKECKSMIRASKCV